MLSITFNNYVSKNEYVINDSIDLFIYYFYLLFTILSFTKI